MKGGVTDRVRAVMEAGAVASVRELAEMLQIEQRRVAQVLSYLKARGELTYEAGRYRHSGRRKGLCKADRVWRAWRMCPTWSPAEVARLAEVPERYVKKLKDWYVKKGLVVRAGRGRYRLVNRDLRDRPAYRGGENAGRKQ